MAELITLDVLDRPQGGRRSLRRLPPVPGVRHHIHLATSRLAPKPRPSPTPRRIGLLTVWAPDADPHTQQMPASREHWHVIGEVVRSAFTEPWNDWTPDTTNAAPLGDDEPALVLISGDLRPGGTVPFLRSLPGVVGQALEHPGYLGGLSVHSSLRNTTSCSVWRTYAEATDYAYRTGAHAQAMRTDLDNGHHRTQWFLRIRPLASQGTLEGHNPLTALLPA